MRNPNPITPRKQLSVFYARQGLTGKQLRSAMRHDLRQVRKYAVEHCAAGIRRVYGAALTDKQVFMHCNSSGVGIGGMFLFSSTREGWAYWEARSILPC